MLDCHSPPAGGRSEETSNGEQRYGRAGKAHSMQAPQSAPVCMISEPASFVATNRVVYYQILLANLWCAPLSQIARTPPHGDPILRRSVAMMTSLLGTGQPQCEQCTKNDPKSAECLLLEVRQQQ